MKRRDFIRMGSFITVSAAALGVTGCNSDNLAPNTITRPMPPLATGGTWLFPQSIASGDPHADSIMLWTRVTSSALAVTAESSLSVAVELRITTADNSASMGSNTALTGVTLPTVTVPAYGDFDGTIRHKLTGLTAGTVYYYQFTAGTVLSKVGRFKTAQAAASSNPVKFAFMSCQEWSNNHWGAFSQIVADDIATPADLDFVVHLGDYIYETDAASSAEALHSAITLPDGTSIPPAVSGGSAPGGEYASELADYRYLYKLYRSDARIQAMHERFPMIAVWDDHEFSDDAWQASETYSNANASQPDRRRNANQAWFEFMPADIAFSETDSTFNNIRIYRDMQFGTVMHLIMTDERLYRTDHVIAETTVSNGNQLGRINSRYLAPEGTHKLLENIKSTVFTDPLQALTILGGTQRDWWKSTMSSSPATWKVWGNEVSLLRMGLNGTNAVTTLLTLQTLSTASTAGSPLLNKLGASAAAVAAGTMGITNTTNAATGALQIEGIIAVDTSNTAKRDTAIATAAVTFGGGTATPTTTGIATIAVNTYVAATNALIATSNPNIAAGAGAQVMVAAIGATPTHPLRAFLQKFLLNADQWDGYRKERQDLMQYLEAEAIQNVVAITGDIHAFFAGQVHSTFNGEVTTVTNAGIETGAAAASLPAAGVMVDLVTAGISSTSWFKYLSAAANALSASLLTLVQATVTSAQTGLPFDVVLPVLDFTMGKPYSLDALNSMARDAVKLATVANGIPEANLVIAAGKSIDDIAIAIGGSTALQGLCTALSALGASTNPWLKHVDTNAQGYAVVTATTGSMSCQFKRLNTLFVTGGTGFAPGTVEARPKVNTITTVDITAGSTALTITLPTAPIATPP